MADSTVDRLTAADMAAEPEMWDYVVRNRERKQRCLEESQKILDACVKDPGHVKTPVSDCKPCYKKIIDCIKHRYLDNPEMEWYADRRTFLQHLAELFPAVRRGEVDPSGIEDRVMDEKRKWYRENVKKVAANMNGLGMPEAKDELLRLLASRPLEFPELCAKVKELINKGITPCPPGSLERLLDTTSDHKARLQVYKDVFFFPAGKPDTVSESTQRYLDMLDQGMSISKVSNRMLEDKRQGIADRAEVERLKRRIEDLKTAKAAWLSQKNRKEAKAVQQPPCAACGTRPDTSSPLSCSVCQLAFAYEIQEQVTVYCSEECLNTAHESHVEESHNCNAGESCIQLFDDEDDIEDYTLYFCKECLESHKNVLLFCSLRCAEANFYHHRSVSHPESERSWSLGPQARGHRDGIASCPGPNRDKGDDVRRHLFTEEQALVGLKQKNVIQKFELVKINKDVGPRAHITTELLEDGQVVEERMEGIETQAAHGNDAVSDTGRAVEVKASGSGKADLSVNHGHLSPIPKEDELDGMMEGIETELEKDAFKSLGADTEMLDAVDVEEVEEELKPTELRLQSADTSKAEIGAVREMAVEAVGSEADAMQAEPVESAAVDPDPTEAETTKATSPGSGVSMVRSAEKETTATISSGAKAAEPETAKPAESTSSDAAALQVAPTDKERTPNETADSEDMHRTNIDVSTKDADAVATGQNDAKSHASGVSDVKNEENKEMTNPVGKSEANDGTPTQPYPLDTASGEQVLSQTGIATKDFGDMQTVEAKDPDVLHIQGHLTEQGAPIGSADQTELPNESGIAEAVESAGDAVISGTKGTEVSETEVTQDVASATPDAGNEAEGLSYHAGVENMTKVPNATAEATSRRGPSEKAKESADGKADDKAVGAEASTKTQRVADTAVPGEAQKRKASEESEQGGENKRAKSMDGNGGPESSADV